ncbi:hypothetical protein CTAYLR_006030 [Chrysophaeum taylorii]|uniref:Sulfotransferase domain-containing protein n=1 Tax=Chrysophaeum taylorii TaxID=2483200 RepID=A0AAD7UJV7_9STRA|nr:hypothetical protein CTAYLR_006030 [Chrysophaeum taylorii]
MARFLEEGDEAYGKETVVLASYPRSGNSLLRGLIERMTGVVTGSDTVPTRTLSKALQEYGVRGEGIIDDRVHVVKTHFPERRGLAPFAAHRAILLVRNPWDVIDSYFNMTLTNSHTTTMHDSQYERFAELFGSLARSEVRVWCRFNRWWLRAPIPLMVVRYEDLLAHRERTLRRVAWFLNGTQKIEGTRFEAAVADASAIDLGALALYEPRSGGGARVVGSALRRFDTALRADIEEVAKPMLYEMGYSNATGFPTQIRLAPRALRRPVPDGDDCHETYREADTLSLVVNTGDEIRDADSPFGRFMTQLRKSLLDPIISDDCIELNVHEVKIARDRAAAGHQPSSSSSSSTCGGGHPSPVTAKSHRKKHHPTKQEQLHAMNAASMTTSDPASERLISLSKNGHQAMHPRSEMSPRVSSERSSSY